MFLFLRCCRGAARNLTCPDVAKAEKSGCFVSCFGSCKGSPAKEGRNGSDDGEEADWDSPVRVPSRRLPAGVLQVVVR